MTVRDFAGGPLTRTILTAARQSSLRRPGLAQLREGLRRRAQISYVLTAVRRVIFA